MVESALSPVATSAVSSLRQRADGLMGPRRADQHPADHLPAALGEP